MPHNSVFEELKIGTLIFLLMLMLVASVTIILQLFVPTAEVARIITTEYPRIETPNPQIYLFYLMSGCAKTSRDRSDRHLKTAIYLFIVVIVGLFLICDSLHPNLAGLSHDRVYKILEHSRLFSRYFTSIPGDLVDHRSFPGLYLFSILSGGLMGATIGFLGQEPDGRQLEIGRKD